MDTDVILHFKVHSTLKNANGSTEIFLGFLLEYMSHHSFSVLQ